MLDRSSAAESMDSMPESLRMAFIASLHPHTADDPPQVRATLENMSFHAFAESFSEMISTDDGKC